MAEPTSPTTAPNIATITPIDSRGPNLQALDGVSGDSNAGGGAPGTGPRQEGQGESSHSDGRGGSGGRAGTESGASLEGDHGVRQPGARPKRENPFLALKADGAGILQTISERFNEARNESKAPAWKQFQQDLMDAAPFILHVIPYKDIIQIASDIEKEIKGSTLQVGKSNEELLADFLTGGSSLPVVLKPVDELSQDDYAGAESLEPVIVDAEAIRNEVSEE